MRFDLFREEVGADRVLPVVVLSEHCRQGEGNTLDYADARGEEGVHEDDRQASHHRLDRRLRVVDLKVEQAKDERHHNRPPCVCLEQLLVPPPQQELPPEQRLELPAEARVVAGLFAACIAPFTITQALFGSSLLPRHHLLLRRHHTPHRRC